jgi:hypothetical protein
MMIEQFIVMLPTTVRKLDPLTRRRRTTAFLARRGRAARNTSL